MVFTPELGEPCPGQNRRLGAALRFPFVSASQGCRFLKGRHISSQEMKVVIRVGLVITVIIVIREGLFTLLFPTQVFFHAVGQEGADPSPTKEKATRPGLRDFGLCSNDSHRAEPGSRTAQRCEEETLG